jgi:hypothetical protein
MGIRLSNIGEGHAKQGWFAQKISKANRNQKQGCSDPLSVSPQESPRVLCLWSVLPRTASYSYECNDPERTVLQQDST